MITPDIELKKFRRGYLTKIAKRKAGDGAITIAFSNGDTRTLGAWCRPSVIAAYCAKHGVTATIVAFRP